MDSGMRARLRKSESMKKLLEYPEPYQFNESVFRFKNSIFVTMGQCQIQWQPKRMSQVWIMLFSMIAKRWHGCMIHSSIVFPTGVTHSQNVWPHLTEWFMVSFSMVAFCFSHFGGCHCIGLPFPYHGKGNLHHWYTTHGSHLSWLEACGVETVNRSLQTQTHIHIKYMDISNIYYTEDTQCTNNSVCKYVRHLNLKCVWCVWAVLLLFSLWQLNHPPPPFPVCNLRLVHIFPQLYGLVPGDGAVMCFIDMLQVTP